MPHLPRRYAMIVFDAGGTLVSADWPRVTRDLAAQAGELGLPVEPEAVIESLYLVWQEVLVGKIEDRADSREAVTYFWNHMLARTLTLASGLPMPPKGEPYDRRAWVAATTFYPHYDGGDYHLLIEGAEETLAALDGAGFRLGLLSNWSPSLPGVLGRLGIDHFFEFVIVSALVGLSKPDPAIFDLAARESGCRPEELLYVGDSPASDICGSQAAGWDSVLIANRHPHAPAPHKINRIAELPDLLELA